MSGPAFFKRPAVRGIGRRTYPPGTCFMKKLLKEMQLLFGAAPTCASFDEKLLTLDAAMREKYRLALCRLAFGYYDKLPPAYRRFTDKYLKHDRHLYTDYLARHTALSRLRYPLHNPEMLISVLHLLENADRRGRVFYHHLASCLLLAFEYPYKLNTLGEKIARAVPDAETVRDFLELAAIVRLDGKD